MPSLTIGHKQVRYKHCVVLGLQAGILNTKAKRLRWTSLMLFWTICLALL